MGKPSALAQGISNMMRSVTPLLALAWFAPASGCANILDLPEAPTLIQSDPFTCTNKPAPPATDKAQVHVHACNFISSNCVTPVTGLTASLCDKIDVGCTKPLQSGIQDVNGDLTFDVPTGGSLGSGFGGFLMVKAPTASCTDQSVFKGVDACQMVPNCDPQMPDQNCMVPTFITGLLFFNPPVTMDVEKPIVLPLIPTVASVNLVMAAGSKTTVDPSLGIVFATALDCDDSPAAGLTFGASPTAPMLGTLYEVNGVISNSAMATDASGIGGLLGIPAGFVKVSAYEKEASGGPREVASVGVQVVPFAVTYVNLVPPSP